MIEEPLGAAPRSRSHLGWTAGEELLYETGLLSTQAAASWQSDGSGPADARGGRRGWQDPTTPRESPFPYARSPRLISRLQYFGLLLSD